MGDLLEYTEKIPSKHVLLNTLSFINTDVDASAGQGDVVLVMDSFTLEARSITFTDPVTTEKRYTLNQVVYVTSLFLVSAHIPHDNAWTDRGVEA